MKDLISGVKKFVKANSLCHLYVPQYETLSLKEIFGFMQANEGCMSYFPIMKEMVKLPKQFIVNVIYTTIGDKFSNWVKERVEARNAKVVKDKNMLIEMDPDIAAAFNNSNAVSISKGISANLLKLGTK